MEKIKFHEGLTNGDQGTTLKWNQLSDKDELLVEVFTTEELFKDLAAYWRDLEKRSNCKICMSFDWAYNWWKYFGRNKQRSLYILSFWDGTRLVGLAPFYRGYSYYGNILLETRLQLIGSGGSVNEQIGYNNDLGISSCLDIIVDESYAELITDRLIDIMTSESLEGDVVRFNQVADDSFILNYLYPRLENKVKGVTLNPAGSYQYLDLTKPNVLREAINIPIPDNFSSSDDSSTERAIKDITISWETIERSIDTLIKYNYNQIEQVEFLFDDRRFTNFLKKILKSAYNDDRLWFKKTINTNGKSAWRLALEYKNYWYDYFSVSEKSDRSVKTRSELQLIMNLIGEGINNDISGIEQLTSPGEAKYNYGTESYGTWKLTIPLKEKKTSLLLYLNRIAAYLYQLSS